MGQRTPADLLVHPALEEGLGGAPQVELGVELAAQALDVQQRLLQQHQLRLDLDIEAARGLEQPHQHLAERDVLERAVEMRLADRADRAFELVGPGGRRHPAGLDVQLGHPAVVALEEGEEVLRQVFLVARIERADDAEVQRDVALEGRRRQRHHDVARVHVGVEEAVAEHLGEEDGHAVARQPGDVDAGLAQPLDLADRHAEHALHHQHLGRAEVPDHLRHHQQVQAVHVAAQLRGVGRLAAQVQLVVQVLVELGDHFARAQAPAVGRQALEPARTGAQQPQVGVDHLEHAGTQHLDRHLAAVVQHAEMHLRDRGAGHRIGIELRKHRLDRPAERLLDQLARQRAGERRHAVLQPGQLVGDVGRHQVAPGGQHLAELDEDRTEPLEGQAQAHAARRIEPLADRQHTRQRAQQRVAELR